MTTHLAFICNPANRRRRFWSAVAERSGDTAFRLQQRWRGIETDIAASLCPHLSLSIPRCSKSWAKLVSGVGASLVAQVANLLFRRLPACMLHELIKRCRVYKRSARTAGVLALLLALAFSASAAESIDTLLQKGLFEEEANHNLPAAIKAYEAVISQTDEQRKLAATAVFRLGECYRKLGKTNEANTQYQRVMRDFADQPHLVKLSRDILGQNAPVQPLAPGTQSQFADRLQKIVGAAAPDAEGQRIQALAATFRDNPDLVNAPDGDLRTPLHSAAENYQSRVVAFLLTNGANVELKDKSSFTPLLIATKQGSKEIVEQLLRARANPNTPDSRGATPAHYAAHQAMRGILELLVKAGANLEAKGRFEAAATPSTPLHIAAGRGYKSVVELLIESKADINAKNGQGHTPLHIAAGFGHDAVVELLLARGADIAAKDGTARTPLHSAAEKHLSTAKLLLQHGADVNAPGPSKRTPLFEAVQANQLDIVQLLLANKANVNATSDGGQTPLFVAVADAKSPELAEILLDAGADVNARNPNSFSVINAATSVASVPLVRAVLKFKPNLEVRDGNGATPLLRAADIGFNEMVKLLLEAGADPNSVNPHSGYTSLHLAAANGRVEIAEMLLAHKADPNIPDKNGRLAFDMVQAPPPGGFGSAQVGQYTAPPPAGVPGPLPHRPIRQVPVLGGPSAAASASTASGPEDLRELLLKHGADTNITRRGVIAIGRNDYHTPMFIKSYTPHSRFTLFDLIARFYDPGRQASGGLVFPDLSRVTLHRLGAAGPGEELQINVAALFREGDCSKNLWLEWGDVVTVPEMEHPLGGSWDGFDLRLVETLTNCLRRQVFIAVKGQTNQMTLVPKPHRNNTAWKPADTDFWLSKHVFRSNLLLSTSDLTRIKVYRTDPVTKEKLELTFDMTRSPMPSDLWLLDGDVIEVPEKPAATAKANQP